LPAKSAKNKTEFMKLLRHERMIELAFEGHRFWDIRRWGLGTTLLNDVHMKGIKPTKTSEGTYEYKVTQADRGNVTERIVTMENGQYVVNGKTYSDFDSLLNTEFGSFDSNQMLMQTGYISRVGKFEFNIGGEKKIIGPGDSTYKEPHIVHGAVCLEEGVLLDIFTPARKDFLKTEEK